MPKFTAPKNWTLESLKKVGTLNVSRGVVKAYRANPSDLDAAAAAGVHYAIKNKEPMIIISGNSYMSKYHAIQRVTDDPKRVTVVGGVFRVVICDCNGDVYTANITN